MPTYPSLNRGPRFLRRWINEVLIPWIATGRPAPSPDCDVHESEGGCAILPRIRQSVGTSTSAQRPFQIIDYGLVRGRRHFRLIPSTLAGDLPDGFTLGDLEPAIFPLPSNTSGSGYVIGIVILAEEAETLGSGVPAGTSATGTSTGVSSKGKLSTGKLSTGGLTTGGLKTSGLSTGGLKTGGLTTGNLNS